MTRKNAIVEYLDYQKPVRYSRVPRLSIPVTQLKGPKGNGGNGSIDRY